MTHNEKDVQRFWSKVQTSDDCWIWLTGKNHQGYGKFAFTVAPRKKKYMQAHRFAYELLIGPIPKGKILDHIKCDNPSCVNPGHLIVTTDRGNVLRGACPAAINNRKTHCIHGHLFDERNTRINIWNGKKSRSCRLCEKSRWRKHNGVAGQSEASSGDPPTNEDRSCT